jgi:NADPH:quinone reductase-like Zn-dependent oxidoreductase
MVGMGMLVLEWPLVLGVDASGVVVEASPEALSKYNLKLGTYVCGCTRLGRTHYSAGQEYFLMDARVTMPKPKNIDVVQAATLGAGLETAAMAVFEGLHVEMFDPDVRQGEKDEWMVVLGGGSNVGSLAIQLLKAAGYKVLASCSERSAGTVKAYGAESFDYKTTLPEQVKKVLEVTGGKIGGIFDAAASDDPAIAKELFKHESWKSESKLFTTTNDWSSIGSWHGGQTHELHLGLIGKPDSEELNNAMEKYIPVLVKLIENGKVKPGEHEIVGKGGFEDIITAYKQKAGGASGQRKLVVKVQDE